MLANEIRQNYIEFFRSKGHSHLPGSPLIPIDVLGVEDKSLLFTGAGMEQFKPYFIGAASPENARICTVQKCFRAVDVESVGDFSHCTFFEMLGNFSFGDYFKAEVIPWTWEFLVGRLGIDPERLCVTVFAEDDEAFALWRSVGLPEDRIHRLGESKCYWPANAISAGPNGPCGPCTEIFYRVEPDEEVVTESGLSPTERYLIEDDRGLWLEIWNNVFTQYNRTEDANGSPRLEPLPKKNNDTGAGFDRIVMVLQGKRSVYETDLFEPILDGIAGVSGHRYGGTMEPIDFALRVVAEHTRSMTFCIADGILPSNEGRGYVLRYIMRRAIRYGKTVLGLDAPFLHEIAPRVIAQMGEFYPELVERRELILSTLRGEEERFRRTLDNGMRRLEEIFAAERAGDSAVVSGADAFMLHDTFGFPVKLTQDIAAERGLMVDMEGFQFAMDGQRRRSREQSTLGGELFGGRAEADISALGQTDFLGYAQTSAEARIVAILDRDGRQRDLARAGEEVDIILDRTPFYAEAGGQVGDAGTLSAPAGDVCCALNAAVTSTRKVGSVYRHTVSILEGEASVGQTVEASVDAARRRAIMRNHTATHLLQAALRRVLGGHVHQKGSLVAPDRLRFDFTHSGPLTGQEVRSVEDLVNEEVLKDDVVLVHADIPIGEARARGAMALFGEKYGDRVRMIEIPGFSLELCGGTHLAHTSQVGLFEIASQSGVAAGVRRVEAVTGQSAYERIRQRQETLEQAASLLKVKPDAVVYAVEKLEDQRRRLEDQVRKLRASGGAAAADIQSIEVAGVHVIVQPVEGGNAQALADFADRAAQKLKSAVIVAGTVADGRVSFAAKVTPDLVSRGLHAGNLVREVARIAGGGGGGRPDFATAGGRDAGKLQEALAAVPDLVAQQLNGR